MPAQKRPPPPSSGDSSLPPQTHEEEGEEDEYEQQQPPPPPLPSGDSSLPPQPHEEDGEEDDEEPPPPPPRPPPPPPLPPPHLPEHEGNDPDAVDGSQSSESAAEEDEFIPVKLADIRKEVQCPICLGIIRKTRTVMECLHRFCRDCIDKSMRIGNNECPACRTHCASRRSLRDDPNYDALIAALYPDIDKYEEEELAFNDEDKIRNMKIQTSIAETFQRQSEALGKKSTAKTTAAAFVRRSRRNFPTHHTQNSSLQRRGRVGGTDLVVSGTENGSKESSSADESSPDKKLKRCRRWPAQRASLAEMPGDDDIDCDEKEDFGVSTSPLQVGARGKLSWGKNGARSQTRHGNASAVGSSSRTAKGGRVIKLIEHLQKLDDTDNEFDIYLIMLPLDSQSMPDLHKLHLCCRPTLLIRHLCQFIALQISCQADEVEIYARNPGCEDPAIKPQTLAREKSLGELNSSLACAQADLELVYAVKRLKTVSDISSGVELWKDEHNAEMVDRQC